VTETFAMLTGHGVSTRQAATLTGLVRSTAISAVQRPPGAHTRSLHPDLRSSRPINTDLDAPGPWRCSPVTFVDLAPLQIYAQLLDEGIYLGSVSTMYEYWQRNTLGRRNAAGWRGTREGVP